MVIIILTILILYTYGLPALVFLLVILVSEYFLYSNPNPKIRYQRNLLLFLLGIFEAGTTSFVAAGDIGLIGLGVGLVFGALVAVVVHIILTLGVIVGFINAIKYYREWKKSAVPLEATQN